MTHPYGENVYFTDEMRYGTRTFCKRRWTTCGHRPCCKMKIGYQWAYLFVALSPYTGDVFACALSHLNKDCFDVFLKEFKAYLTEEKIVKDNEKCLLIGDGATAHQSDIVSKYGIDWKKLPTACPELNPVERFFQELRKHTSNQVFENIEQIDKLIDELLKEYMTNREAVKKLTLFPYLIRNA